MAVRPPTRPVVTTKLHPVSLGVAGGIVWGLGVLILTLVSSATGYASVFLNMIESVYPGYDITGPGAFLGLIYGFIDGFVWLYLVAWLYNLLEGRRTNP